MTEKIVEEAHKRFQRCLEADSENRKLWLDDVKFYAGEQWPDAIKRSREMDNRPTLVVNRLPQFVRQVTNDQRQNRPSIKIRAVDDKADIETAEVMQGLIRHIESNSNADQAYDNAFFYAVVGGYGYFRIVTDYASDTSFEQEIFIKRVPNPNSVYLDPDSSEPDGSDMNFCFIVEEMSREEYQRQYGEEDVKSWDAGGIGDHGWITTDTVRVAEYFWIEQKKVTIYRRSDGQVSETPSSDPMFKDIDQREVTKPVVKWAKICGDVVKEERELPGTYIPVIPVLGDEVLVDGKRTLISLIRFAKDPQRMLNYWRSTETELVALQPKAPFVVAEGQIEGYEKEWAAANSKNFAYLTYKPTTVDGAPVPAPQRQGFAAPPSGVLQGALNAENDLKSTTGIYDAALGARSNETSGKAILARQREGDISTFHFIDNLTRAIRQAGRILVQYIPKIYDTPRVIRILGEDGTEDMKKILQPVVEKDDKGNPIQRIYDFGLGTYDVVCSAGPSYTTQRQESAEAMQAMAQAYPPLMQIAGDLLVKAMDWPGSDDIAERIKRSIPPNLLGEEDQPQIPPMIQEQMQQMGMAIQEREQAVNQLSQQLNDAMMKLEQAQAQSKNNQMSAVVDAEKLKIEAFKAKTDRLKVEIEALQTKTELAQTQQTTDSTVAESTALQDMLSQVTQMQAMIAQSLQTHPSKVKRARAVKQPDGSWAMESIEQAA